jgi:hypothetical protein
MSGHDHDHDHAHDHAHDDDHHHGSELSEVQLRVRALETVLTEKGYVDPATLDRIVEAYMRPGSGRISARAWWPKPGLTWPSRERCSKTRTRPLLCSACPIALATIW